MSVSDKPVAVVGGGTIGASWAALFLAHGLVVRLYDPAPQAEPAVRDFVRQAWPALRRLVTDADETPPVDSLSFHKSAAAAVEECGFVQENVPEQLEVKHRTLAQLESAIAPGSVIASSASGLTLGQMQAGMKNPARLVLGHPFNPPHLIPLVEIFGNRVTDPDAIDEAEAFYIGCGKVPIRLRREVPGHVANRLQAALWREASHLVTTGVASLEDVDRAISAGPGLRWAVAGPSSIFNLGAGQQGIATFCERFSASFHDWWDSLGDPRLDRVTVATLRDGLADAAAGRDISSLEKERDSRLLAVLAALKGKYQLG